MVKFHVTSSFRGEIGVKRILKIGSTGTVFHSRKTATGVKLRPTLLNYLSSLNKQSLAVGLQWLERGQAAGTETFLFRWTNIDLD